MYLYYFLVTSDFSLLIIYFWPEIFLLAYFSFESSFILTYFSSIFFFSFKISSFFAIYLFFCLIVSYIFYIISFRFVFYSFSWSLLDKISLKAASFFVTSFELFFNLSASICIVYKEADCFLIYYSFSLHSFLKPAASYLFFFTSDYRSFLSLYNFLHRFLIFFNSESNLLILSSFCLMILILF